MRRLGEWPYTSWALALLGWMACGPVWAGTVGGTATYRERIALPPDAVFEAVLQDVSQADAPAVELGRARLEPAGLPPFKFEIACDDGALRQGRRYAVRASVTQQGRLLFTTDRLYPVLDGRNAPLTLRLVSAREGAGNRMADSPLRGTTWKLVHLDDLPVRAAEGQREAHLVLASEALRVSGSGGCNRITGSFELDGDRLRFGRMASTRMACPDGMEQEQRFLASLEKVERYRILGNHLEVLDAAGAVLARFEAEETR